MSAEVEAAVGGVLEYGTAVLGDVQQLASYGVEVAGLVLVDGAAVCPSAVQNGCGYGPFVVRFDAEVDYIYHPFVRQSIGRLTHREGACGGH